ncbi:Predicted Zn-dependent protease, minimal metalloprotease (MMP)-like domain [Poseidonocella pacifica]|uniref:Predicted Zn-dependent protease, minimal metalloprotease (MMP)-like domain n=1 Tax=Poseidonocella pacifica TaxID=871651 RepID=A0A1I0WG64_9RHOB|nr:metallopeptidase family protein [Poseidonocella pacifica]SFA87775.1 Predicted Zn-dependent protease, minimal metalloprotease (MMP)-like domain [Poseidonocella pacifica]
MWSDAEAPGLDEIETLAIAARDSLPESYARAAQGVGLRVEDFAPEHILEEVGAPDPFSLTGLYDGVPLTEKSVMDQPTGPDTIWLFRRAILDEWADRGNVTLGDLVAHVFVHELAHHFGWSDERIAEIGRWWDYD